MTDLIRDAFAQYEQRMVDTTDGLAFQRIRLDEVVPGEEQILRIEAIADPTAKSPEQIYIQQETMREMYAGLEKLSDRAVIGLKSSFFASSINSRRASG